MALSQENAPIYEALVEFGKMITGDGSINSYVEWMKKMQGVRV